MLNDRGTMVRTRLRTRMLALATLLAAGASGLALAPTAQAAPLEATGGTLTWAVSPYVGTSSSLLPERLAEAPATVASTGWTFTGGGGTYDPDTGAATLDFTGAMEFGNVNQGNYGFKLSNPSIVVEDDGDGRLVADVATRGPGAPGAKSAFGEPVADVTVVTFTADAGDDDAGTVTWTVTPDTEAVPTSPAFEGAQQFPASFLGAFSPSLAGHFRQSNAAGPTAPANLDKLPAPITFSLGYEAPPVVPAPDPEVAVAPSSDLDPTGDTVTIDGTGFTKAADDPSAAGLGVYVRYCVEAAGEVGTAAGRPGTAECAASPQHWVGPTSPPSTAVLAPDGTFEVTLDLSSSFTVDTTSFDCAEVTCGIAVRRDHNGGATDFSYDSFTPVTFTAAEEPEEPEEPTEPEPPAPGEGALDWGVKASFHSYILTGPAAGTIDTVAPASTNADGTFRFEAADGGTYDGPEDVTAPFEGTVHFSGHDGLLDLVLTDPRVDIDGDTGTLVVDATSKGLETGEVASYDDVTFATLDLSDVDPTAVGDDVTFADIPATLTTDGAEAFAGFYDAGADLDPVTFVIAVDDPGELPGPTEDVVGCVPSTAVAGSTIPVCGEGFLAGEQVQIFLHSDPVQLAVVTADADGAVSTMVTIPATTAAGTHQIELRGVSTGRSLFSADITITAATAGSGALPRTGVSTDAPLAAAGVLLTVGLALVLGTRRRRLA